jgi:hypothetical protein
VRAVVFANQDTEAPVSAANAHLAAVPPAVKVPEKPKAKANG